MQLDSASDSSPSPTTTGDTRGASILSPASGGFGPLLGLPVRVLPASPLAIILSLGRPFVLSNK